MKSLKAICNVNIPNSLHSLLESSILDIEDNIESGDIDTLFSLLISGNEDNFRIARNIIYNDVISTQKQLRRKNEFKENNLYIQFFNEPTDDKDLIKNDMWGLKLGTCNYNVTSDERYDIMVNLPHTKVNSAYGAMFVKSKKQRNEVLKMNSYLKRPVYLLPEKYRKLFKKLFVYSFEKKAKRYDSYQIEKINDEIKKI